MKSFTRGFPLFCKHRLLLGFVVIFMTVCQFQTVEGLSCTGNKFKTSANAKQVCVDCFCSGLNARCRRSMYFKSLIHLKDDVIKVKVTDKSSVMTDGLYFNSDHEVILGNIQQLQSSLLYWSLPEKYLGNQVLSYGGFISYSIFYDVWSPAKPYSAEDVVITGKTGLSLIYRSKDDIKPKETKSFRIELSEGNLLVKSGRTATRKEIMKVLSWIETILIRATYCPDTKLTILSSVSMETAIPYFTRHGRVSQVEQCICPEGYSGTSCESCRRGYTHSTRSGAETSCVRCQCNRHTLECHPETGICKNCKHNTFGDYCEKCIKGYYGNAKRGTTGDCQRCRCPLRIPSNQFSSSCHLKVNGAVKCDACQKGYRGDDCGECANGYSGNPRIPGGKCENIAKIAQRTLSIRVHPHRRVDPLGFRTIFRCEIEGASPYHVTWSRRDARPLPVGRHRVLTQKGTRVLIISSITVEDDGDYLCTARNRYGVASKKVWMNVHEKKVFPIDAKVSPKSLRIPEGSSAMFLCSSSWNMVTHTKSWSREGYRLLPPSAKSRDGTLVFKNAKKKDSGVYTCTASNQATTASATVVLIVGAIIKPQVSLWPVQQTVDIGGSATFHCTAAGFPKPEIHWSQEDDKNLEARYSINSKGLLVIKNVRVKDEGQYLCNARNAGGRVTTSAMLYVRSPGRNLSISVFPKSHKVSIGKDIAVTCVASGRPLPSVSWTSMEGQISNKVKIHNGVLTIRDVNENDSGYYLCTAKNPYGAARAKVKVKVYRGLSKLNLNVYPKTLKLFEGDSAKLLCNVTGDSYVITWSKANGILTSSHAVYGKMLRISNVDINDQGTYFCSASNNQGVAQGSATVTVTRKTPPKIVIRPFVRRNIEIGGKAHFRCVVTEGQPITALAWYRGNGSLLIDRIGFQNETSGLLLELNDVAKMAEGDYICAVKNQFGFMRAVAVLSVSGMPKIDLTPLRNYQALAGSNVIFECKATGYPVPDVEWIFPRNVELLGATISSWQGYARIQMKATENIRGKYHCNASNTEGVAQDSLFVTVHNRATKPSVTVSPNIINVNVGKRVEIRCLPSGIPSPEFIWVKLRENAQSQVLSSKRLLVLEDVRLTDEGTYACRAWNKVGIAQDIVQVITAAEPNVSVFSSSIVATTGRTISLQCNATGYPQPSINWTKTETTTNSYAVINGRLDIQNVRLEDAGEYRCEASNRGGLAFASVYVTVLDPPKISPCSPKEVLSKLGNSVLFCCNASGYPPPRITWYEDADLIRGAESRELRLTNVTSSFHGQYKCRASNLAGFAEDVFSLGIEEVPTVTIKENDGKSLKIVPVGQNITLNCIGTGNPEPVIQWNKIGGKLPGGYMVQDGTLLIVRAKVSDAGTFRCSVFNPVGYVHAEIRVFVQGAPTVTVSPKSLQTQIGKEARFSCEATGMPLPSVTWYKIGARLPSHFIENGQLILPKVKSGDRGDYVCRAANSEGIAEDNVKLRTTAFLPRFSEDGLSYIIFGKILGALYRTTIEISFRLENDNGLLLYNGRPNEDFISIGIKDGYVIFQYNLGSGPAFIKSSSKLSLFQWHTVEVYRDGLDGTLRVDDEPMLYGKSKGKYTGLNLAGDLFVGGHANLDVIKRQTMHKRGFTGCISQLRIAGWPFEISENALMMVGISDCNICLTQPCKNNGLCLASATRLGFTCECQPGFVGNSCNKRIARCFPGACGDDGICSDTGSSGFKCKCPIGKHGSRCEIGEAIQTPSFSKNSFMVYPGIKGSWQHFNIFIKFRPISSSGVLLFNGGIDTRKSSQDYILIQIIEGHVQLVFDSGSGPAFIKSSEKVVLSAWNTIEVERFRNFGSITLNSGTAQKGRSRGSSIALNLGPKLFIGGAITTELPKRWRDSAVGFHGCVQELLVNEERVDLVREFKRSEGITNCLSKTSPCQSSPCKNNATCKVLSAVTYNCKCPSRYYGRNCERFTSRCGAVDDCLNGGVCTANSQDNLSCQCKIGFIGLACQKAIKIRNEARFKGDGYLEYPRGILKKVELSILKFDMRSKASDGLIFWFGEANNTVKDKSPDFLAVGLKNGFIEVSYELGSGLAVIISSSRVNDGEWHTITVNRAARNASLWIDGKRIGHTQSSGVNTHLDIAAPLYFGGGEDVSSMTRQKYQNSYVGCLSNVYIEDQAIKLQEMAQDGRSVHPCTENPI